MELDDILKCLQRIEARQNSDEYEYLGFKTVGINATGSNNFIVRSPVNTECEWALVILDSVGATPGGAVMVSGSDPSVSQISSASLPSLGLSTNGQEFTNAFDGFMIALSGGAPHMPSLVWSPLGRGANVYISASVSSGGFYATFAFRRKLDRAIPRPPRREPHTHSQPTSRRGARTFTAGFEAQYPHDKYIHEEIPVTQDTAAIGNVANMTPAQQVLAKLRNGGR